MPLEKELKEFEVTVSSWQHAFCFLIHSVKCTFLFFASGHLFQTPYRRMSSESFQGDARRKTSRRQRQFSSSRLDLSSQGLCLERSLLFPWCLFIEHQATWKNVLLLHYKLGQRYPNSQGASATRLLQGREGAVLRLL